MSFSHNEQQAQTNSCSSVAKLTSSPASSSSSSSPAAAADERQLCSSVLSFIN